MVSAKNLFYFFLLAAPALTAPVSAGALEIRDTVLTLLSRLLYSFVFCD